MHASLAWLTLSYVIGIGHTVATAANLEIWFAVAVWSSIKAEEVCAPRKINGCRCNDSGQPLRGGKTFRGTFRLATAQIVVLTRKLDMYLHLLVDAELAYSRV